MDSSAVKRYCRLCDGVIRRGGGPLGIVICRINYLLYRTFILFLQRTAHHTLGRMEDCGFNHAALQRRMLFNFVMLVGISKCVSGKMMIFYRENGDLSTFFLAALSFLPPIQFKLNSI